MTCAIAPSRPSVSPRRIRASTSCGWFGYLASVGPAGSYCVSLSDDARTRVKYELFDRLGSPAGTVTLSAVTRRAIGHAPNIGDS